LPGASVVASRRAGSRIAVLISRPLSMGWVQTVTRRLEPLEIRPDRVDQGCLVLVRVFGSEPGELY
jgi:hypothetical protein